MMRIICVALVAAVVLFTSALPVQADITRDDLILLGLVFRNRVVPYSQQDDADPAVLEIAKEAQSLGRGSSVDPETRYKTMIKGLAMMYLGDWNEGIEMATVFDMRVTAKLFEPGGTIQVKIAPVYPREGHLSQHFLTHVRLVDENGRQVGEKQVKHFHEVAAAELTLAIPADAPTGRYTVEYSLTPHDDDEVPILTAGRNIYVLNNLSGRLAKLAQASSASQSKGGRKPIDALAATTAEWHHAIYSLGLKEDVPGAYTGHPLFMTYIVGQAGMVIDRMDFVNELALAEDLARGLAEGKSPLVGRSGDMRLAYRSGTDNELVPFRIFVPKGYDPQKKYPLVIGLHGAGGDENSFMDRYDGLYKSNAQKRGYIAVSVNGRGPYGGYRGDSARDVIDVLDLVQSVYPIDTKRTYLTGHSMGGGGTVSVGFDNAGRFAALAPIAGFGAPSQLEKAKEMPLFIGQGDEDALVPVERARQFHQAALDAGMAQVKYVERKGVEHLLIVNAVMDEVFDWFDSHTR